MGRADEYCLICAGPIRTIGFVNAEEYPNWAYDENAAEHEWLVKNYLIFRPDAEGDEEVLETDSDNLDENYGIKPHSWNENTDDCIVCHMDCLHTLERCLGFTITFAAVGVLVDGNDNCTLTGGVYGAMEKHTGEQDFDYDRCFRKNPWLLFSPFRSRRNRNRIVKTWFRFTDLGSHSGWLENIRPSLVDLLGADVTGVVGGY
jgi:hypothetical protein